MPAVFERRALALVGEVMGLLDLEEVPAEVHAAFARHASACTAARRPRAWRG